MQNLYLLEFLARSFSEPCARFSMHEDPGGTGCDVPENELHRSQFHRHRQALKIVCTGHRKASANNSIK